MWRRSLITLAVCSPLVLWPAQGGSDRLAQGGGTPSFGELVGVLEANDCIRCHRGSNPGGRLDLSPSSAWQNLVNQRSAQARSMYLVAPGNANESYFYLKLTGRHIQRGGRGVRMPLGRGPMSDADLSVVRDWIEGGAPR